MSKRTAGYKGITSEIVRVLRKANGEALTADEIFERADNIESGQQVRANIHTLYKSGELQREANANGRFAYRLNSEYQPTRRRARDGKARADEARDATTAAPAPPGHEGSLASGPHGHAALRKVEVAEARDQTPGLGPIRFLEHSETAGARTSYDLGTHIRHALADLEDLFGDAIKREAPHAVLKELREAERRLRGARDALQQASA